MNDLRMLLVLSACLSLGVVHNCRAASEEQLISASKEQPLPALELPYHNSLYATVASYLRTQKYGLENHRTLQLAVPGFRDRLRVRAMIQHDRAPLVVVLLGVFGRGDAYPGTMIAQWLGEAGFHVLTLDSTFLPDFTAASGQGVTGNVLKETELLSCVINAFLQDTCVAGRVSNIGVAGFSYGGVQALQLGVLAKQNCLPFKISAIQVYSPPIRFEETALILDRWYLEDRPHFTAVKLQQMFEGHRPVPDDVCIPFSDSAMRAAIAESLRADLKNVILQNNRQYHLELLPHGNEFDDQYVQLDHAATWGFHDFMARLAIPYWLSSGHFASADDFLRPTRLSELLPRQPDYCETILTLDDPLNDPFSTDELRRMTAGNSRVVWLPRGGHLGFINEPWTRAKLLRLFPEDPAEKAREAHVGERHTLDVAVPRRHAIK